VEEGKLRVVDWKWLYPVRLACWHCRLLNLTRTCGKELRSTDTTLLYHYLHIGAPTSPPKNVKHCEGNINVVMMDHAYVEMTVRSGKPTLTYRHGELPMS
jgi:hypothetical protein